MKNSRKGFTLIELLVVIAIIGILSSVIMPALNLAREKGSDAAIKANLASIRAQAEIIYDDDGDYDRVCGSNGQTQDSTVSELLAAANAISGQTGRCGRTTNIGDEAWGWAASSPLKSDSSRYWCVDYLGTASESSQNIHTTGQLDCPDPS